MRRGLASMLMGLALVLASAGWAGLTLSATVLDPNGSRVLADHMLDRPSVQAVMINRLGAGMSRVVPGGEPMSSQELAAAATAALEDDAASAAIGNGLVEAHRRGLQGQSTDEAFAHFDSNEAARLALIASRPSLKGQILVNPLVRISLPVQGLAWLSGLKYFVDRFAIISIALGLIGFAAAFVVAKDATATMRRAAWWILGAAAGWTIAAVAFGTVVRTLTPSSYIVLASALEQFFASMRGPAAIMTAFGIGMLAASHIAPIITRRRGAYLVAAASPANRRTPASTDGPRTTWSQSVPMAMVRSVRHPQRLSADWLEGHGYVDDARVALFLKTHAPAEAEASIDKHQDAINAPGDSIDKADGTSDQADDSNETAGSAH